MRTLPPPTLTPQELKRFQSRIATREPQRCWRWIRKKRGPRFSTYGVFVLNRNDRQVQYRASNIAVMLHYGYYPTQLVCHTCDHPWCVNPHHLFEGSQLDNIQDMVQKNRGFWRKPTYIESKAPKRILFSDARIIRDRWARYQASEKELMREYNISHRTLNAILNFDVLLDETSLDVVNRMLLKNI